MLNVHDFSLEIMEAWREWNAIFKGLKEKTPSTQNSTPSKIGFNNEGKIHSQIKEH